MTLPCSDWRKGGCRKGYRHHGSKGPRTCEVSLKYHHLNNKASVDFPLLVFFPSALARPSLSSSISSTLQQHYPLGLEQNMIFPAHRGSIFLDDAVVAEESRQNIQGNAPPPVGGIWDGPATGRRGPRIDPSSAWAGGGQDFGHEIMKQEFSYRHQDWERRQRMQVMRIPPALPPIFQPLG